MPETVTLPAETVREARVWLLLAVGALAEVLAALPADHPSQALSGRTAQAGRRAYHALAEVFPPSA